MIHSYSQGKVYLPAAGVVGLGYPEMRECWLLLVREMETNCKPQPSAKKVQ